MAGEISNADIEKWAAEYNQAKKDGTTSRTLVEVANNVQKEPVATTTTTAKKTTPQKTAQDMQKKKEDAIDEQTPVDSEQIKNERIKKEYAEVKEKLDEEKKNVMKEQAKGRLAQNQATVMADLTAEQRRLATRELQLRAANDAILQEEREAADAAVTAQNLQTLSQLSEAEKKKLDEYINKKLYLKSGGYVKAEMPEELVRKYGAERASELAETYWREKNAETARKYEEAGRKHANEHSILSNVATVPVNMLAGIVGATGHAADADLRTGQYQTLDPNAAGTEYQKYSAAIRDQTVQNIEGEDPNGWRKAASIAYQGGMGLLDATAQAYTLGGSGAALVSGSNTFSQTMSDASAAGATPEQAVTLATTSAVIEGLSEKIPMDNLVDAFKGSKKAGMEMLKSVLLDAGIGATSEEIAYVGTTLAEIAILKEKSGYRQDITNGILSGLSPAEAVKQANNNLLKQGLNTLLVSLIAEGGGSFAGHALNGTRAQGSGLNTDTKPEELAKTREDLAKRYGGNQDAQAVEQETERRAKVEADKENAPQVIQNAIKNQHQDDLHSDTVAAYRAADIIAIQSNPEAMQWLKERGYNGDMKKMLDSVYAGAYDIQPTSQATPETNTPSEPPAQPEQPAQQQAAPEQNQQPAQQEAPKQVTQQAQQPQQEQSTSPVANIVADLVRKAQDGGTVSNKDAAQILSDPEAVAELQKQSGTEITGTNSERRTTVKDIVKQLVEQQNGRAVQQESMQQPQTETQQPAQAVEVPQTQPQEQPQNVQQEVPQVRTQDADNGIDIKGTGAAEQNFTGTAAYDDLLSDDNVQPPRRNDAREIEVPKTDAEGKNVSRFMSNAMNASVTTDEFTDTIKKMVIKGEGSYDVVSDESMLQQAAAEIKADGGMTESVNKLRETAQSGKVGNTDIAKGELLYAQLVNDKSQVSQEMAADVLVSLKEMATTSGRNLHLFSLLQKLTPEGRLMTVKKTVDRYVESINEGRSGRQKVELDQRGKEGKKPASNSVKEARKTAGNDATKAANSVRYKNNKVTVEGNQSGEPFVFEYAQKVGEALAQGLERKPKPKAEKTFLQTITGELRKFAQEKIPQSQKGRSMTATELLKDYVQNQDFYNQAWETAQYELQQKHGNDPRLQEFLGSGIGVDANVNPRNKIFSRALASAAMESGETVSMLRKQQALGITNMSENIAQKLIDETGATGEIAQTIRDAAKEYVNSVTRAEDSKNNAKTYTSGQFVDEAMRDIRKSMSDVAKMNKGGRDAVKQEVVRTLVDKYGFGQADASHVADVVSNTFNVKAQDQARKILEQKFGEREKAKPKNAGQLAEEYANLGAFDQESKYSDQATESIIRAAMHDIGKTVSDLAKSGKTDRATAMDQISQMITERHGLDKADADHVASVVSEQLTAMVEGRAKKILEQKFATRPERVQKTAEQMLAEYAKLGAFDPLSEYNEKATAKIAGEQYNAKINSDLADVFVNATTQAEQEAALDAIYKDVAAQIKPTLGEQWDAWRNLAMMGNAKTHERNMGSTAAFQPFVDVKRTIAATIESAFVNKENRTKAVLGISKNDNALVQWAKGDAKSQTATEAMQQGGTGRDTAKTKIQEYRKILPGVLDTVSKKNMQLMEKEDMLFKRREYSLTLASFLKSKGYTAEQVTKGQVPGSVLAEGRQIAIQEAMKATFTDRNRFSDAAARLHVKGKNGWSKALNAVAKGAVPFTRTPANVVVRVKEYSPFEIARGFHTLATKVQTGEATIAEGIEQIASGMTGSLMYAAGAALKAGIIPGVELIGRIEDEDEYPEEAQEYSVRIGDKYYGVGWLAPAAIPLFIGANLYGSWSKKEANGEVNDAWDAVDAIMNIPADIIDPMLELSMLSSLKDLSDTFSNAETAGRGMLDVITTAAANYFTQGLPTILGQAEQATETTKTTTFINTDNPTEKTVKGIISNAAQRIPGVDAYRTQKLDQWGRPVEVEGDLIDRAINAFLNPFTVTQAKEDPLMDEIKRLNKAQEENVSPSYIPKTISYTDKDGNLHKDYRLTEEEYQKMAEVQGQTAREILDKMIESPSYKGMDDGMKAKAMQMAYSYAREKAKGEVLGTTYSDSWMMGMIKGTEANKIIMKVSQNELNSALSNIKTARANNYSKENQTKYVQDLEKAYTAYSKMDSSKKLVVMESATGDTKKYLEVRQKGATTNQYLQTDKEIEKLKPDEGYKSVLDIQEWEVIARQNMNDTVTDAFIKAYMQDYDPTDKSPVKTELKYDYARQELDLTPQQFVTAYEINQTGKKDSKFERMEAAGFDDETAEALYRLLSATGKTKIDTVEWYNSQ